jgi:hypothetical protein
MKIIVEPAEQPALQTLVFHVEEITDWRREELAWRTQLVGRPEVSAETEVEAPEEPQ